MNMFRLVIYADTLVIVAMLGAARVALGRAYQIVKRSTRRRRSPALFERNSEDIICRLSQLTIELDNKGCCKLDTSSNSVGSHGTARCFLSARPPLQQH